MSQGLPPRTATRFRALPLQRAMAATAFDEVLALSGKAQELYRKSHYERCTEKWRAALAAAEAIGAEDCVLVAAIRTEVARALLGCEDARDGSFSQAFVLEMLELLAASAAILRRRRDAGTLMEGKCRPNEVQWYLAYLAEKWSPQELRAANQWLRAYAQLVGYDMFLGVCSSCMFLVCEVLAHGCFERGGEAERSFLTFFCNLCDESVALMVQPRVHEIGSSVELVMVPKWPVLLEAMALAPPEYQVWRERVSRAYARLRQSGVLERRGLEHDNAAQTHAEEKERRARSIREHQEAAASGQLKSCALAGCDAQEAHLSHFGKCSACKAAVYCCRDHQQTDWPAHKAACKAARKAAAAAKDAS